MRVEQLPAVARRGRRRARGCAGTAAPACRSPLPRGASRAGSSLSASQGVTVNAIASEISMPMLALIGIGLMYGPIRPVTKAIGSSAAITVKVARMVGPPTSSTASRDHARRAACRSSARAAVDVLHHHDGVVHQDADGEDQREQRHAVQREAPGPGGEQRRREREQHRDADDQRLAPAERRRTPAPPPTAWRR